LWKRSWHWKPLWCWDIRYPTNPKKRKLLHVLDDSEVVFEEEEGPTTQVDLQRWFVDDWDKITPVKISRLGAPMTF
jgi:sentrin-specific protease 1